MSTGRRPRPTSSNVRRFDVWFGGIFLAIGLTALVASAGIFLGLRPDRTPGTDTWAYLGAPVGVGTAFTLLGGVFFGLGLRRLRRDARLRQTGTTAEAA